MRLELAGACWNVPELAQGSANLLSTFKDCCSAGLSTGALLATGEWARAVQRIRRSSVNAMDVTKPYKFIGFWGHGCYQTL